MGSQSEYGHSQLRMFPLATHRPFLGMEELSNNLIPVFQNSWVTKEEYLNMFSEVKHFKLNLVNCELNLGELPEVILPC